MMEVVSRFFTYSVMELLFLVLSLSAVRAAPSSGLGGFESQVGLVLQQMRLPNNFESDARQVVDDLLRVLQELWPGTTVVQFGSSTTGLALRASDVDCFVFVPDTIKQNADDATLVSQIKSHLQHTDLFTNFHMKLHVSAPVLSFDHAPTGTPVDLTLTNPLLLRDEIILAGLLKLDKKIWDLAMIVKYWSHVHAITGSDLVIPSYTMLLLVIFYLQQRGIIPSIAALQENTEPIIVDHWNVAFTLPEKISTDETLYDLLGGFFQYYSNFNFDDVISPYCGCVVKREQMENLRDLPKALSSYEQNLKMGYTHPFHFGPLNTQDILQLHSNTGRPLNSKSMVDNLVSHAKTAAKIYETKSSDKFLLTILKTDENKDKDYLGAIWSRGEEISERCLG